MLDDSTNLVPQQYIQNFHGDLTLIVEAFEKHDLDIREYLPPEFQEFADDIKKLRGTQLNNLIGSMLACAGSLFAFSMNGAIASQCTSLPLVLRATIASSPLLVGGFLRVYSAYQADLGRGRENILELLGISALGMLANIAILHLMIPNEDLSKLQPKDCWPLIASGAMIGLGLGTYASGMTLGARTAANNSVDLWHDNLQEVSDMITNALIAKGKISSSERIQVQPGFLSKTISFILRQRAAIYSAVIAGVANTSSSIPITVNAYADVFQLSNSNRTVIFAGIQIMTMMGIYALLNNPVYDQLLKNNKQLTPEQAKRIAIYAGQTLFASGLTLSEEIKQLTPEEMKELYAAIALYSVSYGVLTSLATSGTFTMIPRCVPPFNASITIARAISVSSICRAIPLLLNSTVTPTQLNQGSLLLMTTALGIYACVDKENIPESMMYVYAAFCGVVCYAVVARLVERAPNKVGFLTGFSSGVGAFVGFPLSLTMAWLQSYNPVQGQCPDGVPHETMSLQLLLPAVVSAVTLASLLVSPAKKKFKHCFTTFKPVATKEIELVVTYDADEKSEEIRALA